MHARKFLVDVTEDHQIAIRLPEDFPRGPVEVIVLASVDAAETRGQPVPEAGDHAAHGRPAEVLQAFARRFPVDPVLSQIVLHEDPSAPLDAEDWPEGALP